MKAIAREHLALGLHVVIDAVNPFVFVRQAYLDLAAEFAVPTAVILTACGDPVVHRARIENRQAAGLAWIDWSGVERQVAYYEPHDGESLAVDAMDPPDANITAAVGYVLEKGRGSN
jgi:predicted kinase